MNRKFIAGNWKMNGLTDTVSDLAAPLAEFMKEDKDFDMLICPPFLLVDQTVKTAKESNLLVGVQNCHAKDSGAFTGETSPQMIKNIGASHAIVGHSERRAMYGDTNEIVKEKAANAHNNDIVSIICVGESKEERESGAALAVVSKQIKESMPESATAENTIVAYEPVWAIGTGLVASLEDVKEMHAEIRKVLGDLVSDADKVRILYGGSVKPENAKDILATENVDGVLVGGASLVAEKFIAIAESV